MQVEKKQVTTLDAARAEIDAIDTEVIALLKARLDLAKVIVDIKAREQLPIYQPEREVAILKKIEARIGTGDYTEGIKAIYTEMMKQSRRVQSKHLVPYNIVLVGFMGTGKTSVGAYLAERLDMACVDTDQLIADRMDMCVQTIFDVHGEPFFRQLEANAVHDISVRKQLIVSCGGGVVLNPENVTALKKNGKIIWLTAKPGTLYERLMPDGSRPLLREAFSVERIEAMLAARTARYRDAADFEIETDGLSVEAVGEAIVQFMASQQ